MPHGAMFANHVTSVSSKSYTDMEVPGKAAPHRPSCETGRSFTGGTFVRSSRENGILSLTRTRRRYAGLWALTMTLISAVPIPAF